VKRLIGRKMDSAETKKAVALSSFKVVPSPNGDAWVDVRASCSAPGDQRPGPLKMKATAEDYLGEPVTEAVITVPPTSTTASARPPRTPGASPG
jgi:molecular chaperone DnaK